MEPIVTVLLASFDRLPLLRLAVASALAQDHPAFEVLVVDDGSGPETAAWLRAEAARAPQLRVIFADHAGVAAARARGIEEARGELVTILDSDDLLEPGAVRRLADRLAARPEVALVYGNIRHLYADGTSAIRRYPRFGGNRAMALATLMAPRVPFKHSGMTFRRAVARAVGSYDPRLPSKIDIDLVLRLLRAGHRLEPLGGAPVVAFRVHPGSMSRRRRPGIAVWFHLIDTYGPPSRTLRAGMKAVRGSAELLKEVYVWVQRE